MTDLFACSRMYNVSPEVTAVWNQLYTFISKRSGVPLNVITHSHPDPIEELWARPNMGCVLMCGYPYAHATPRPKLIASLIPSPAHYEGKSIYFSHLLVAKDSPFQTIEDTFGHRISWTIKNSQSGFNAIRSFLLPFFLAKRPFRSGKRPFLYKESIGPIGTFAVGVEGIHKGEIDVVPIDSFSYDLMLRYTPEKLAGTRIIATTPPAPFPPLVAGHDVDDSVVARIKTAVLQAHQEPALQQALQTMMIKKFIAIKPSCFDTVITQARKAEQAGYPMPA